MSLVSVLVCGTWFFPIEEQLYCFHLGGRAMCSTSRHTVCHHKSTRADTPVSCLRTLSKTLCFPGNPLVSINVASAAISACHWRSTSWDVWRVESKRRQGCTVSDRLARWLR